MSEYSKVPIRNPDRKFGTKLKQGQRRLLDFGDSTFNSSDPNCIFIKLSDWSDLTPLALASSSDPFPLTL
jgi:hypothetical protein